MSIKTNPDLYISFEFNSDYICSNGTKTKCYICSKPFICYPEWVYKRKICYDRKVQGRAIFCTYGCMRKYDKIKEEKR